MIPFRIKGDSEKPAIKAIVDRTVEQTAAVQKAHPDLRVEQFGDGSSEEDFNAIFNGDMKKAGAISLPITLVVLLFAFGALLVAGIPVLLAVTAVMATLGLVGPLSQLAPVDDSFGHVVLLIGLAVGVDYSLFYLRRAREEKAAGATNEEAIDAAAATSGHSVLVSGLTVMVAMAGMYLAGAPTFVSFATGTILVVASAMLASLTVLPALMSLMGDKIHRQGRVPGVQLLKRGAARVALWSRVVDAVTRRPVLWGGAATVFLVALSIPALGMNLGTPPLADSLPQDEPVVQTFNRVRAAFPAETSGASVVVKARDVTLRRSRRASTSSNGSRMPIVGCSRATRWTSRSTTPRRSRRWGSRSPATARTRRPTTRSTRSATRLSRSRWTRWRAHRCGSTGRPPRSVTSTTR